MLGGWRAAQRPVLTGSINRQIGGERWIRPDSGWIKFNTDAAVCNTNGQRGFGWIARNANGQFLACASYPWPGICSVKELEALAVREALIWLISQEWEKIVVETDALQVVSSLAEEPGNSYFDLILDDIRVMIASNVNIKVSHVKRSANRVAHKLARVAVSLSDRRVWLDLPPSNIVSLMANDLLI
ncbi:unnamed protein product [Cuscuta epithymum]|uniref:RNase H type-1 domain-containing protein n=1 Tax=Cuscuta epithymum TaxID=186058 RepID=A0AAV0CW98_9ASTE|nr:unnamed protein product [Cuscuta epithymum]